MAPGGGCTVMLTFTPTATGTATGSLTFVDNAGTQTVGLSGVGTTTAPIVTVSPGSLLFPDELIGAVSGGQTVTITNTGTATVANGGVTITGNFAETTTCGGTLRAGGSCKISVTFDPTAAGQLSGTLSIAMATGTLTASLTGTGVTGAVPSVLAFNPQAVSFNNNYVVGDNPSQTITVMNTSNAAVALASILTTGDPSYTQQTNCGTLLTGGASCTISITFMPTTYGTFVGQVTITEGSGTIDVVPISGTAFLNGG